MGDTDSSIIKISPVGSRSGNPWDEKGNNKIVQIFISHDDEIRSIQFQYAENGNLILSERHGTNDGYKFDVVKLKYPAEYITHVSGHKSSNHSHLCSITFGTNLGEHGPFGRFTSHDKEFSFNLGEDRQFYGFHGLVDNSVKSIGVYLKPITTLDYYNYKDVVKVTKEGESWEVLNGVREQFLLNGED